MNARAPASLLFADEEGRLAALEELARKLWLGGLTNSQGELEPRLAVLAALRAQLRDGDLAPAASWRWPPPALAQELHDAMTELELPRYCAGDTVLADTVLASALFHLDLVVDYRDRGVSAAEARRMAIAAFAADWRERCGQIDELVEVFGMLPEDAKSTRWDRIRGVLHSAGWQDVLRARRLLERLPRLARIIRALGRARPSMLPDRTEMVSAESVDAAVVERLEPESLRVPDMPGETRGVHRSGRIARMLPAEAMLLGHPLLRLVWHARRAERTLLNYEDDERMQALRLQRARVAQPRRGPQAARRPELGPIVLCVDTSGSMQGGAEAVAKAVVLEAMRSAHAQQRACYLFAFGGPGEVLEAELALDAAGIERLAQFLAQAFHGGTDICAPLERAMAKLEDARWQQADLLIASDGEFGATPDTVSRLAAIKRRLGLRVQGVLVGDRESVGFLEIADDIFPVRDWRRYGGAEVDSPVHTHRLTALYFPGALRGAQQQGAVSGAAAPGSGSSDHGDGKGSGL